MGIVKGSNIPVFLSLKAHNVQTENLSFLDKLTLQFLLDAAKEMMKAKVIIILMFLPSIPEIQQE